LRNTAELYEVVRSCHFQGSRPIFNEKLAEFELSKLRL